MNTPDPLAELYAQVFAMIDGSPQFRRSTERKETEPVSKAMLAKPYKGTLPKDYACEPKIDGVRVIVEVNHASSAVTFKTRNGNPLPSVQHFAPAFANLSGQSGQHTFDCEVVSGSDFYDGVGNIRSSEPCTDAVFWLLDIPDSNDSYADRRTAMQSYRLPTGIVLVPSFDGLTPTQAFKMFSAEGFEGAMIKDKSACYLPGKRSPSWLKVKAVDAEDCPIVSVHEGKGRLAGTMGYVVVEHNGVLVRVGGGFTDAQRTEIWEKRDEVTGSYLEVCFQNMTAEGSFRHPRVRGDK